MGEVFSIKSDLKEFFYNRLDLAKLDEDNEYSYHQGIINNIFEYGRKIDYKLYQLFLNLEEYHSWGLALTQFYIYKYALKDGYSIFDIYERAAVESFTNKRISEIRKIISASPQYKDAVKKSNLILEYIKNNYPESSNILSDLSNSFTTQIDISATYSYKLGFIDGRAIHEEFQQEEQFKMLG